MVNTNIKIVFGAAAFNEGGSYPTPEEVEQVLQVLEQEGVKVIDSAQIYGTSEELLGHTNAASRFLIDTKHCGGFQPGQSAKEDVIKRAEESLKKLKTDSVNVFYIHAPDRQAPLEETLMGIDELYRAGKFKQFGLSNFLADEVEDVCRVAMENNFVLPTVYQGNYNPIARKQESALFPTLRKHNIAFYAYSPLAGGFLAKSKEQLLNGASGRWDPDTFVGKLYHALYNKPAFLGVLDAWDQMSKESGIPKAELAYRWVAYHSNLQGDLGDAIIVGASSISQLKQTTGGLRNGPLSGDLVKKIEEVWEKVKDDSVLDNFNDWFSQQ